jgi:hypothetical protein
MQKPEWLLTYLSELEERQEDLLVCAMRGKTVLLNFRRADTATALKAGRTLTLF